MGNRNFGQSITDLLLHFFPTWSSMTQHGEPLVGQNPPRTAPVWILSMGCNLQEKSSESGTPMGCNSCSGTDSHTGCSVSICSNMVFHDLQGNFCSGDRANPPPLNSVTLMLFLSLFPHPFLSQMVYILFFFFFTLYQILYHRGAMPQSKLTGSVLVVPDPFGGSLKLVLSDIKTAPSVFSQKPLL